MTDHDPLAEAIAVAGYGRGRDFIDQAAAIRAALDAAGYEVRPKLDGLECPAAKHHRVRSMLRGSRIIDWNEGGPEIEPDTLTSDRCVACGYDFLAALNDAP